MDSQLARAPASSSGGVKNSSIPYTAFGGLRQELPVFSPSLYPSIAIVSSGPPFPLKSYATIITCVEKHQYSQSMHDNCQIVSEQFAKRTAALINKYSLYMVFSALGRR